MKTLKEMSNEELIDAFFAYGSGEIELLRRLESEANLRRALSELAKTWTERAKVHQSNTCLAMCAVELTALLRGSSGSIPAAVVTGT
jgi:hypothetical protein